MAKKASDRSEGGVNKSAAIREYLTGNPDAMPKEIVAALAEKGVTVSPQMVSVVKAKSKVTSTRKGLKGRSSASAAESQQSRGLDAALLLYKAASGTPTPSQKVRDAFLSLVEVLG